MFPPNYIPGTAGQSGGGGGGGGSGANTVTITVTDDAQSPLQGATVTAKLNGITSGTGSTDVDGVVLLALDDATYTVNVTCFGFNGEVATLEVDGDTEAAYELASVVITPSPQGTVTGWLIATKAGIPTGGITHILRVLRTRVDERGASFEGESRQVVSADNGLVQFTGLVPGARYVIKRGTGVDVDFVAATEDFNITDCIG